MKRRQCFWATRDDLEGNANSKSYVNITFMNKISNIKLNYYTYLLSFTSSLILFHLCNALHDFKSIQL